MSFHTQHAKCMFMSWFTCILVAWLRQARLLTWSVGCCVAAGKQAIVDAKLLSTAEWQPLHLPAVHLYP